MDEEKISRFVEERCLVKQESRIKDSDQRKTYDEVFDERALKIVYKFMIDGLFETVDFPVSTGKEGNVFRVTTKDGEYLAMKIYRTSTSTFKHILKYIEGDPRFSGFRSNKRRLLAAWSSKEFRNLKRMHVVGVSVPEPIAVKENVIVMEYLGEDGLPYPLLKDVELADPQKTFDITVEDIGKMYTEAGLVHGDLSEYNIMYSDRPHIIDVGQAVLSTMFIADELMKRDRDNLIRYFRKAGVDADPDETLERMCGR